MVSCDEGHFFRHDALFVSGIYKLADGGFQKADLRQIMGRTFYQSEIRDPKFVG